MVRQFQDSGLSRRDFSKQCGVPLSTLGWWLAKAKGKSAVEPVIFSEIRIIPSEERLRPKGDWAMEIEGPGGLIIRCRDPLSQEELKRLLGVSSC